MPLVAPQFIDYCSYWLIHIHVSSVILIELNDTLLDR